MVTTFSVSKGNVVRAKWRLPSAARSFPAVVALILLCGLLAPAAAQSVPTVRAEFAAGNLEFRLPDTWSVEGRKLKMTLVAPGEDAFIEFALLQPGNDSALRAQVARQLTVYMTDVVVADPGDSTIVNDMPGFRVNGTGSSDATSVKFTAIALLPSQNQPVLVLAYASEEAFASLTPAIEGIFRSLKRR